jgi:hypothetical protein
MVYVQIHSFYRFLNHFDRLEDLRELLSKFTHLTKADTIGCHRLSSVDIVSMGSLGPIMYFKVLLGHFEGYFDNSEKGPKMSEVNPRITQIPWWKAKILLKFVALVALVANTPLVREDLGSILHPNPGWHFFGNSHLPSFRQWT